MEKVFDWFSTPFERFIHQERASGLLLLVFTAAIGGIAVPAFLYILIVGETDAIRGWGILMSTDIAFAMDALVDYYGDGASLDELQAAEIRSYLLENGADRARAFAVGSDARDVLPRITTMRYFRREHSEIPTRVVRGSA